MNSNVAIPKWVVTVIITLGLAGWAAFSGLSFQARSALPRVEAYETFVKQSDHNADITDLDLQLKAIAKDVRETRESVIRMEARLR